MQQPQQPQQPQQQLSVLVVEDRSDWQTIIGTALRREGYEPYIVASYTEALDVLGQQSFAMATIDPVLDVSNRFNRDGLSIIQTIQSQQPEMPMIIITGSLTRDMQASLNQLHLKLPVILKESWNPSSFAELIQSLVGIKHEPAPESSTLDSGGVSDACPVPLAHQDPMHGQPRVLIVENRTDWQTIVGRVMDSAGYFWRVAANAQDALHELERESFHLVILDLKLQSNDVPITSSEGWLLLDYLVEARPSTKVAILSGEARPGDVAMLVTRYPIVGFIEKQRFTPQQVMDAVAQATQAPSLRIQTFGQFRLWRNNQAIVSWDRPQAETVVKLLLVRLAQGGRTVAADELITYLWPDADEESGRKKLQPLISNARHTLEPDIEPRDSHFILRNSNGYFFDVGGYVTWDLLNFREHVRLGRQLMHEQRYEDAIVEFGKGWALYTGDFLAEDCYAEWVIGLRRRVASEVCDGLTALADCYAMMQDFSRAIEACETVLNKDPLRESVYRRLMCLHVKGGDKGQAIKVYRNCTTVFEELFGEGPTPVTRSLYQAIVNDEPVECDMMFANSNAIDV